LSVNAFSTRIAFEMSGRRTPGPDTEAAAVIDGSNARVIGSCAKSQDSIPASARTFHACAGSSIVAPHSGSPIGTLGVGAFGRTFYAVAILA
jgi:hypothetical protein